MAPRGGVSEDVNALDVVNTSDLTLFTEFCLQRSEGINCSYVVALYVNSKRTLGTT
jgi:hypothetical protein